MSNKTPAEPAKKTALAPKKLALSGLLVVLGLTMALIWGYIIASKGQAPGCGIQIIDNYRLDEPHGRYDASQPGYKCLRLETVDSPEAIRQGLSGRESLPSDQGLLFVFPEPGQHCLWMKDMKFSIDMIWLDADKKVVTVKEDVQPDSFPDSFCPSSPAKYVIEVNSGVARKALVSPGSQLRF